MFESAKNETAIPKFRPRDGIDDMGNWPFETWRLWLPERVEIYFAKPEAHRRESIFSPFFVSFSRSYEPLAAQMHEQLRQFAGGAIPHLAAIAREGAMRWQPEDNIEIGRFYIDLAGLCDAPRLAEMTRALDQKFPAHTPGPALEPIFASVSDFVLEKMQPAEILYLVETMRTRRGANAPEAFIGRAEYQARKTLRLPMPEHLMRWER